ncbi:MAG: alpha/beta hydrolase [Candidatus Binatus sp.]|uniref:alpha/beta hydrolase n=1 Tax=Candidatus Binatus sp. TaxID=2811406 RepID=UPI002724E275|nr:alpha/beta hydrolase [Candidatus Binatus sp.]MDO8434698.1 alpha/beta hydrolase [Candidatus Binatus sp.]
MSQQQLDQIVQMLKAQPILASPSLAEPREGFEKMAGTFPVDADVKVEPVNAGGIKAEWIAAPGADAGRSILYLHGGGYVIGSINTHRSLAGRLSRAAKARVLVIDYRLAPEHPFPAAVDDSVAAYRWMLSTGLKPARTAVAGDSAGGGLAIATLVAIRDAKLPSPAAGVGLSPWVDLEGIGESMQTKASIDPMVQRAGLLDMAKLYLGGKDARSPLAAPLYADLTGLPPLLIQVGTAETLMDDSTRIAERARKAGVKVTLQPWENMVHVWHLFAAMLDEGQQAIEKVGEFVRANAA